MRWSRFRILASLNLDKELFAHSLTICELVFLYDQFDHAPLNARGMRRRRSIERWCENLPRLTHTIALARILFPVAFSAIVKVPFCSLNLH